MTRICSISGCQSRHHANGFCRAHDHRWKAYGDPTFVPVREPLIGPRQVAEMVALAEEGLSRQDIAAITGWSYPTVRKYVGHIVCGVGAPTADVDRYRRMLAAARAADYGEHESIAHRFGLKNAKVFRVMLVKARRAVALEEAVRREAAARGEIAHA